MSRTPAHGDSQPATGCCPSTGWASRRRADTSSHAKRTTPRSCQTSAHPRPRSGCPGAHQRRPPPQRSFGRRNPAHAHAGCRPRPRMTGRPVTRPPRRHPDRSPMRSNSHAHTMIQTSRDVLTLPGHPIAAVVPLPAIGPDLPVRRRGLKTNVTDSSRRHRHLGSLIYGPVGEPIGPAGNADTAAFTQDNSRTTRANLRQLTCPPAAAWPPRLPISHIMSTKPLHIPLTLNTFQRCPTGDTGA